MFLLLYDANVSLFT